MPTRHELYHGNQTNLIVPLGLYNEHQILCSQKGLDKEVGMVVAGYEINPRNFVLTDYKQISGTGGRGSIVLEDTLEDKRRFVDEVILTLLKRTRIWDRICGLDVNTTDLLFLEGDKYTPIVRGKKIIGGSHTHPQGYGADLSTTDKDAIHKYIEFARKWPMIHASSYGGIEWVVEPKHEPSQNANNLHFLTDSGSKEINLIIAADIGKVLKTEFGR